MSLPIGYKRLEYIQSSRTQYIKSGFVPSCEKMRVVVDFMYCTGYAGTTLFGAQTSSFTFPITAYNAPQFCVGASADLLPQTTSANVRYLLDVKAENGTVYVDINGTTSSSAYSGSLEKTLPVSLFGNNVNGSTTQLCPARMYSFKIYDNDILVRDFQPCINASGEVGLYDLVGQQFYGNAGTGTFTAGPVIAIAADESEIKKLKYIQSSGTQYINSGFVPSQNTRVVMECMALSLSSNGSFPFGTRESYIKNAFEVALTTTQTFYNYGTKYQFANFSYVLERMTIAANKNVCTFSAQSGTVSITLDAATFTAPTSLIIGSAYDAGSIYTGKSAWNGYIYSCQIYDNGTLVRDFVPCINASGEVGLYDLVGKQFYGNAGTGVFTGSEVA